MNKTTWMLLFLIPLLGCEKKREDYIIGYIQDYYTKEPLANVELSFSTIEEIGPMIERDFNRLFLTEGSVKSDYRVVSDEDGSFYIGDMGGYNNKMLKASFVLSYRFDSTKTVWRYSEIASNNNVPIIERGGKTVLLYKPAGWVSFSHPLKKNPNSTVDSIQINVHNQQKVVTRSKLLSGSFDLLPSAWHEIQLTYFRNGQTERRTIKRYVPAAYRISNFGDQRIVSHHSFGFDLPE